MSHAVLDDESAVLNRSESCVSEHLAERTPVKKSGFLPVVLSVVAIVIAVGAHLQTALHDPLGPGLDAYDFSTPKAALISEIQMDLNVDIRAQLELSHLFRDRRLEEKLRTLEVHKEVEWKGCKVLFVSYDKNGMQERDSMAFTKDAESGYWRPTLSLLPDLPPGSREQEDPILDMRRTWREKGRFE